MIVQKRYANMWL